MLYHSSYNIIDYSCKWLDNVSIAILLIVLGLQFLLNDTKVSDGDRR